MKRVIEFIADLVKLAVSALTALFAVCGAAEIAPQYVPWLFENEDVSIGLGIVYFLAVMLLTYIGIKYYKQAINEAGKKK